MANGIVLEPGHLKIEKQCLGNRLVWKCVLVQFRRYGHTKLPTRTEP